jgi:hypothetical protein
VIEELTEAELAALIRSGEWEVVSPPNARIVDGHIELIVTTANEPVVTLTTLEVQ